MSQLKSPGPRQLPTFFPVKEDHPPRLLAPGIGTTAVILQPLKD
jgi:hypothetical protein